MSKDGLYTSGSTAVSAKVDSIPLRDTGVTQPGQDSIGTLISNASEQVSTLVRGEIELAKAEIIGEAKKGAMGGGMFAAAGVIALYSTFFLFLALAAMLASWMHPGWALLLVFLIMLVLAGLLAFAGFQSVKRIKAPERTIESVNELKNLVPGQAQANMRKEESGLYTTTPVAAPQRTTGGVSEHRVETSRTVPADRAEVHTTRETQTTAQAMAAQQPRRTSGSVERKNASRASNRRAGGGSTAVTRN